MMSKLKLCPLHKMAECSKDKCSFWIENMEIKPDFVDHEPIEVKECSIPVIVKATLLKQMFSPLGE